MYDLIIKNGYTPNSNNTVSIAIRDGMIKRIAPSIDGRAHREINANGNLISPGFVDCHMHIDRAFAATGGRQPAANEEPFCFELINEEFEDYFIEISFDELVDNIVRNIRMAVEAGTTHIRSHVSINPESYGMKTLDACLEARKRTQDIVDLELVPAVPNVLTELGQESLTDAINAVGNDVLLGGSDPASGNNDIERTINTWYKIAADLKVDIDVHIHDGGTLGVYTLERLAEKCSMLPPELAVTASHSYGLAHIPSWRVNEIMALLNKADMRVVTCYQSTRTEMPLRALFDNIKIGHGTDNDRDFVFPHGNADPLEAALILSNKLHGDRTFVKEYRWFDTNQGLQQLWDLITTRGAEVLDKNNHSVEEGSPADLVVFDEPSPQWAIISQANRDYVLKDGNVVVKNNSITDKS